MVIESEYIFFLVEMEVMILLEKVLYEGFNMMEFVVVYDDLS